MESCLVLNVIKPVVEITMELKKYCIHYLTIFIQLKDLHGFRNLTIDFKHLKF